MDESGWKATLKSLTVIGEPQPVRASALDAYERETRFKLPASYRSFCRVFGPGDVGDWFSVSVPGFKAPAKDRWKYDLAAKTAYYRAGLDWAEYSADPEQFARSVVFADDCTGAMFLWDPAEATSPEAHECAVYAVWRDWTQERVSDTFVGFIDICLHHGSRTLYDEPPRVGFRVSWTGRGSRRKG